MKWYNIVIFFCGAELWAVYFYIIISWITLLLASRQHLPMHFYSKATFIKDSYFARNVYSRHGLCPHEPPLFYFNKYHAKVLTIQPYYGYHTCIQWPLYMYKIGIVHVYNGHCTCKQWTLYMYTMDVAHVYNGRCTCMQWPL